MHSVTLQALLDEFVKISARLVGGRLLPEAADAVKKVFKPALKGTESVLEHAPGSIGEYVSAGRYLKATPHQAAELAHRQFPGLRQAAEQAGHAAGASPKALTSMQLMGHLPTDIKGNLLHPPQAGQVQQMASRMKEHGVISQGIQQRAEAAERMAASAPQAPSFAERLRQKQQASMATGAQSPMALRAPAAQPPDQSGIFGKFRSWMSGGQPAQVAG